MIRIVQGDITTLEVDAIVNAANQRMLGGGGVDGAIHRAAGPALQEECITLNGCETGNCKITKAYNITSARCIIHAVGPRFTDDGVAEKLWNCYYRALRLAADNDCHSVAFPCISTGVYGVPIELAAKQALNAIAAWFRDRPDYAMDVILCCYREEEYKIYTALMTGKEKGASSGGK